MLGFTAGSEVLEASVKYMGPPPYAPKSQNCHFYHVKWHFLKDCWFFTRFWGSARIHCYGRDNRALQRALDLKLSTLEHFLLTAALLSEASMHLRWLLGPREPPGMPEWAALGPRGAPNALQLSVWHAFSMKAVVFFNSFVASCGVARSKAWSPRCTTGFPASLFMYAPLFWSSFHLQLQFTYKRPHLQRQWRQCATSPTRGGSGDSVQTTPDADAVEEISQQHGQQSRPKQVIKTRSARLTKDSKIFEPCGCRVTCKMQSRMKPVEPACMDLRAQE